MNIDEEGKQLLNRLQEAILGYEEDQAKAITESIISKNIDAILVMNTTIAESARLLGEKYQSGEIFLPHLVMAGDVMSKVSDLLESSLSMEEVGKLAGKTVVIGTVEGDVHSIGKNIVAMLLKANGFKVFDIGVDVKSDEFIRQAQSQQANIIAMSSLLTTTMPFQREIIEMLDSMKLRSNFKVLIGGGPVTQEWADEIHADGYGKDAIDAVAVAKRLLGVQ